MPSASTITIKETLALLDGPYLQLSRAISEGEYAFWLGSGISRGRVIGLDGVLAKLIEFLRLRVTAVPGCPYNAAMAKLLSMASPSAEEKNQIDLSQPSSSWVCLPDILSRLWSRYSEVLSIEIPNEDLDYLLWEGLDFKNTFAAQDADAEHLAIAMLALEGTVTALATANWDGLLEAAMSELGYADLAYRVTVTGQDLRGPAAKAVLYKFHGCALRAITDEPTYRKLLVARSAQITGWMSSPIFKIVRDQLEALIQRSRTLMIGMSAQDENIKNMFGQVGASQGWKWSDIPAPIVFAEDELKDDQKSLLIVAYGSDYEANREEIWKEARLPAYAKPLLLAILLRVLTVKLQVLASDVTAQCLGHNDHISLSDGLIHLRDRVAAADDGDRLQLAKTIACAVARGSHQLQNGASPSGAPKYFPIDEEPAHLMKGKLGLLHTGQREAAAALGLIGLEDKEASWITSIDDPRETRSGSLRLTSDSASARVFFAANDDNITNLLDCGAFDEDDGDVVIICSRRVSDRQQRSPSLNLRDGRLGPRYLGFGPMLAEATSLDELRSMLKGEIAI